MSQEITFLLEPDNGKLTTEVSGISTKMLTDLRNDLGSSSNVNCGKPRECDIADTVQAIGRPAKDSQYIWLYRIYHNSVVDGPGRRTVIQVAGCSIRCQGCYVPETHERTNGKKIPISLIVLAIKKVRSSCDGVTILGGEPFDQPTAVAELVARLKAHGIDITVYSGYAIEALIKKKDPSIDYILAHIDVLIDGPYLSSARENSSDYRGSSNQRIISMSGGSKLDVIV